MKTIQAVLILGLAALCLSAQTQTQQAHPPTFEGCTSHMTSLGAHPEKFQTLSFKDLFTLEQEAFLCNQTYKNWNFSLMDATITQLQLERCEDFIHRHQLDGAFFKEDEQATRNHKKP